MRIAVFDPCCGISGNMVLGALLDAGLQLDQLQGMLSGLGLEGWDISSREVLRGGLRGILATVAVAEDGSERRLTDIVGIISSSELPDEVRLRSLRAFEKLAEAEASVHGISPDEVHFHEVGALDAIIDIVGAFCGLHLLGVEKVYSSPVATGTGTLECSHGVLPVPSPATLGILDGIPVSPTGIAGELTTPTGAAIISAAVDTWTELPPVFCTTGVGYGAGDRELSVPNLLRIAVGETGSPNRWEEDECFEIRTVIDDMDPRCWPEFSGRVLDSGAVDCYGSMCIGRKGRPALEAVVICHGDSLDEVLTAIFRHSTTLGVRIGRFGRAVLSRQCAVTDTEYGPIRIKKAYLEDRFLRSEPEFEDCAAAAKERNVPVREVIEAARRSAMKEHPE